MSTAEAIAACERVGADLTITPEARAIAQTLLEIIRNEQRRKHGAHCRTVWVSKDEKCNCSAGALLRAISLRMAQALAAVGAEFER